MRKTLYLKFVLAYIIFGVFGFVVVATFVSSMTTEHLKREKADALYEDTIITHCGQEGLQLLREYHFIESCAVLEGRKLYAL